jgi:hypothetical protein
MNETMQGLMELIGRCLARRWLGECGGGQDEKTAPPNSNDRSESDSNGTTDRPADYGFGAGGASAEA